MKCGGNVSDIGKLVKVHSRRSQPRLLTRIQMMVLLNNQYSELAVSLILGLHPKTVARWSNRFQADGGIQDRPKSGRPPKITLDIVQKVIAFYCQCNPLPGCNRWSVRWMAVYFQKHPEFLNVSISASTIHRCLNSNSLRLYRRKYFLQICDPYFFEKWKRSYKYIKLIPNICFALMSALGCKHSRELLRTYQRIRLGQSIGSLNIKDMGLFQSSPS